MPVYCLIAKSVQDDPQWILRYRATSATLTQMFNQKLKQGWDQIRAADALSDERMRQNAQFLDSVGRQEKAMMSSGGSVDGFLRPDGSGGGGSSGRTSTDNVTDLIGNVDTMNDPSTGGTKEVSNLGATIISPTASATTAATMIPTPPLKTKAKMAPGSG